MAVSLFLVFYNIFLTAVMALAMGCTFFLYCRRKHVVLMAVFVIFAAYMLDNTVVFCTEMIPEFGAVYNRIFLQTPSVKTIYFVVLIGSLLFALHGVIPAFSKVKMFLLIGIHGAVLICVPMISKDDWMVFSYYFTTQLLMISISIWGLYALRNAKSSFDRGMLRRVFLYFLCMSILVLLEDSVVIFFVDRYYGPRVRINNRNFSENILYLGMALPILRYTILQLKEAMVAAEPVETVENLEESNREQMDLYTFAAAYNLTEREQEILAHLLQAKSQQEISEELVIALGTVKTHIHNIYQKTDSTNRNHIMAKYREFCSLRSSKPEPK